MRDVCVDIKRALHLGSQDAFPKGAQRFVISPIQRSVTRSLAPLITVCLTI